ncbi:metal-dependent transcriptional regulator [Halopenitus salinus]|uniref:Metal-dependent transcriptional regulator n=1 Tax=Halopenitus salinus TaxID=1198295 RepID=A0ABD5UUE6_9EURY
MSSPDRYLRAIYALERSREGDTHVTTGAVADVLDVHPSSATEMFAKLDDRDLLRYEKYEGVRLTERGRARGRSLLENSCILQRFLRDVLDVEGYREEAQAIEPVLDPEVAERLSTLIDRRSQCPRCFDEESGRCGHMGE